MMNKLCLAYGCRLRRTERDPPGEHIRNGPHRKSLQVTRAIGGLRNTGCLVWWRWLERRGMIGTVAAPSR